MEVIEHAGGLDRRGAGTGRLTFTIAPMAEVVFGDDPEDAFDELWRVTRPGGWIVLSPGNNDRDNEIHSVLAERSCRWSRFEEPQDGLKRKYWFRRPPA